MSMVEERTPIRGQYHHFPVATQELTDEEIIQKYGPMMRLALAAFQTDIDYLIEMAENGRRLAAGGNTRPRPGARR
ncbi:MAG: hypothetical protein M3285_00145 [Actinomycetota bacterium]|nr:hypothetical protein [Actinomycetota bacterium]